MSDPISSDSTRTTVKVSSASPNYVELIRFLIEPFLESPASLRIDCEVLRSRVLVRLAFEGEDKGRVFGRGGRNIQALRTVLQAVAQTVGQSVHLDIFGGMPASPDSHSEERTHSAPRSPSRRPSRPRSR